MDFKRFRIAVLSTALLLATNTLAAANHKADVDTEPLSVAEIQPEQKIMGKAGAADPLNPPVDAPAEEPAPPAYPWGDLIWEIIHYQD